MPVHLRMKVLGKVKIMEQIWRMKGMKITSAPVPPDLVESSDRNPVGTLFFCTE